MKLDKSIKDSRGNQGKLHALKEEDDEDGDMEFLPGDDMDDPGSMGASFTPESIGRVRRKKKKVQYYTDTSARTKMGQVEYHAGDGSLLGTGTGKIICDCLQEECVGCQFPCPKCRSPKCGAECRNNRKWYYETVEVEGTGLIWLNKWVKK